MSRIAIHAAALLVAASPLAAQIPQPVTAPVREARLRYDALSGTFARVPVHGGHDGGATVYDNTCASGAWLPLRSAAQTGGTEPQAVGDWGAIPGDAYAGGPGCVRGCQSVYDVSQFEIAYCTRSGLPPTAVVNFWDLPQSSCTFGPTLIGGVTPPATPPVFSIDVTNLPRAAAPGLTSCYQVTIDLGMPMFALGGATNITPGDVNGDRFAWSIQFPTTDGNEGPLVAGNPGQPTCGFCTGTIWEVGNESPLSGTGFGQDDHLFLDSYGGTPPPQDCLQLPGLWSGLHLELGSPEVCELAVWGADSFCDASDGSLASCPCLNPGAGDTGCDNAQMTGGVGLQVLAQDEALNRATLLGTGYPTMSQPASVLIRSSQLDPNTPVVFGDGLRCVSTTGLVRLAATLASGGAAVHRFGHSPTMAGPGFFYYQAWYRSNPAGFCLGPIGTLPYNLSNGRRLYWAQ